jgi:hypothetical protein
VTGAVTGEGLELLNAHHSAMRLSMTDRGIEHPEKITTEPAPSLLFGNRQAR